MRSMMADAASRLIGPLAPGLALANPGHEQPLYVVHVDLGDPPSLQRNEPFGHDLGETSIGLGGVEVEDAFHDGGRGKSSHRTTRPWSCPREPRSRAAAVRRPRGSR